MMRRLLQRRFQAMGTQCAVRVTAPSGSLHAAAIAIAAGQAEVAACERTMTRFDATSELMQLNARAGEWVEVSRRLYAAIEAAVQARAATGGLFDPTVLPALVAAGYDRSFDTLRPGDAGTIAGWSAGAAIELGQDAASVRLQRGAALDLGGIGKGLAAARAVSAMRMAWPGLPGALVDLGGDLAVWGSSPEGGWRVGITDPRGAGMLGVLRVGGGGVATSGRDRRRLGPRGERHHLIDPATGRPALPGPLAVTVVAATAAAAEAHATALAITPVGLAEEYVAARPGVAALLVPAVGEPIRVGPLPVEPPSGPVGVAA